MLVKFCFLRGEYSYLRIFENIEKFKLNNFVVIVSEMIIKWFKYLFLYIFVDYVLF